MHNKKPRIFLLIFILFFFLSTFSYLQVLFYIEEVIFVSLLLFSDCLFRSFLLEIPMWKTCVYGAL